MRIVRFVVCMDIVSSPGMVCPPQRNRGLAVVRIKSLQFYGWLAPCLAALWRFIRKEALNESNVLPGFWGVVVTSLHVALSICPEGQDFTVLNTGSWRC